MITFPAIESNARIVVQTTTIVSTAGIYGHINFIDPNPYDGEVVSSGGGYIQCGCGVDNEYDYYILYRSEVHAYLSASKTLVETGNESVRLVGESYPEFSIYGRLASNTTYYWKVVAYDSTTGLTYTSDIWEFRTNVYPYQYQYQYIDSNAKIQLFGKFLSGRAKIKVEVVRYLESRSKIKVEVVRYLESEARVRPIIIGDGKICTPLIISEPNPPTGSIEQSLRSILKWKTEGGYSNHYDVYLSTTKILVQICYEDVRIAHNIDVCYYDPGFRFDTSTIYYWRVVARDVFGNICYGEVWDFRTGDGLASFIPSVSEIIKRGWYIGGDLNKHKSQLAGAGTQSAGLSFGGLDLVDCSNRTEEYNGSSWCTGGDLNVAREDLAGCGTQTAALSFGGFTGYFSGVTEHYEGTIWHLGGELNTDRLFLAGVGTQIAGLSFGGYAGGGHLGTDTTEEYNGTSWCIGGKLNAGRILLAGCGTQSAGLSFGGVDVYGHCTRDKNTEHYNGVTWSYGGNLNRSRQGLSGCGTQTASLSFGGYDGISDVTERYDGVTWYSGNSLNVARGRLGGCGVASAGLSFGGHISTEPFICKTTEEWS